jgi:hypothetical protein
MVVVVCGLSLSVLAGQPIRYRLVAARPLSRFTSKQLVLLSKLNHVDSTHLARLSRILAPDRWDLDEVLYSPLPQVVPQLSQEGKAIIVDLAGQAFGAYESGNLVRWGPVSSGRRSHQTPSGTYHLNWHARIHVSTEDPTWVMPWYFNFATDRGLALHQYALPGRPASHGCVRMLPDDAKWLFQWGDGWTLSETSGEVVQRGTLVLLLGRYDFRAPQPWLQPAWWSRGKSLPISEMAIGQ